MCWYRAGKCSFWRLSSLVVKWAKCWIWVGINFQFCCFFFLSNSEKRLMRPWNRLALISFGNWFNRFLTINWSALATISIDTSISWLFWLPFLQNEPDKESANLPKIAHTIGKIVCVLLLRALQVRASISMAVWMAFGFVCKLGILHRRVEMYAVLQMKILKTYTKIALFK